MNQTNFVHEKVLQPLNDLLKLLEVPNKLIQKRKDKLLDYECARSNYDKLKDKNLIKAVEFCLICFCIIFFVIKISFHFYSFIRLQTICMKQKRIMKL